ncbi:hypothetical protein Y032_0103g3548 [Ancylostoma ceylanicum]|uniref:Uncharacterized protein n=1 Tax=Ancylostoma ceylanicum TaxID=53326 RepID=A0A016TGZ5_9BILA|nr:hypothetical protein Y032_0103g3548 [Ancylostoma ceylanicum]
MLMPETYSLIACQEVVLLSVLWSNRYGKGRSPTSRRPAAARDTRRSRSSWRRSMISSRVAVVFGGLVRSQCFCCFCSSHVIYAYKVVVIAVVYTQSRLHQAVQETGPEFWTTFGVNALGGYAYAMFVGLLFIMLGTIVICIAILPPPPIRL